MSYRWERDMVDASGRVLIPPRLHDSLRTEVVWAVYRFIKGSHVATGQSTECLDLISARAAADRLNVGRQDHNWYFKVFRLAG